MASEDEREPNSDNEHEVVSDNERAVASDNEHSDQNKSGITLKFLKDFFTFFYILYT